MVHSFLSCRPVKEDNHHNMEGGRNKWPSTGPNGKFYGLHQRKGVTGGKGASLFAADNSGRSRSSTKASTRSRSTSARDAHAETADTRGRSRSTFRKKKQASVLSAEDEHTHKQLSPSSYFSIDRSLSRPSSQRWLSSETNRSSTRGEVRSQSCRPKSDRRTTKGVDDVTAYIGSSRTVRRSSSMPRNKTEAPNKSSAPAKSSSSASSTHQGKPGKTKATASSTTRTFVVEVDESMNILKLNEVSAYSETPLRTSCRTNHIRSSSQSTRDGVRQNRRRSLSCEPQMTISRGKVRQNRRRSSSCEPPMTRPSALYSPLYSPIMGSSFTSRSRSGLSQSVSFSIRDENTEDIITRVSSYSRQVPQIRDSVDLDATLKNSLSSTEATSIINDDEEDSLGLLDFEPFRGESEGCSSGSTLAVVASAGEVEQCGQVSSKHFGPSTRRSFIGYKPIRRTVRVNTHSYRSDTEENETSSLMTDAASCLETQQKTRQESKRTPRIYKMINRHK